MPRQKKIVCLTHVLRYSPYFLKLKEMIDTKRIGDLVSIQHFEPVDHIHMSHSYVRPEAGTIRSKARRWCLPNRATTSIFCTG